MVSQLKRVLIGWSGQLLSALSTSAVAFAISIWIFQTTGSALLSAVLLLVRFMPALAMSPFAGILVDRRHKTQLLLRVEIGLLSLNLALACFFQFTSERIWILFLLLGMAGCLHAVRHILYSASITVLVKQNHFAKANGLVSLIQSTPMLVGPMLGACLLSVTGPYWMAVGNAISYSVAILTLLPLLKVEALTSSTKRSPAWLEMKAAFRWIIQHPRIRWLQLMFSLANLFNGLGAAVLIPYLLLRTGNDQFTIAQIASAAGIGAVVGGLLVTLLPDLKQKILGILICQIAMGVLGREGLVLGGWIGLWIGAQALRYLLIPITNSWNQAIWQSEAPVEKQGAIFGARRLLGQGAYPIGLFLGGWLADRWLGPMFDPLGQGTGMGYLLLAAGTAETLTAFFLAFVLLRPSVPQYLGQSSLDS